MFLVTLYRKLTSIPEMLSKVVPPIASPLKPLPDNPLVSIIMPSFNQGAFIGRAIDSILSQSYRPLELIVIDGASTDDTVNVLKNYESVPEVRWWSEPDRGPVDAVNKGFLQARGDVIGIQSSDDGYMPGAVASAVKALQQYSTCGLVYADVQKIDGKDQVIYDTSNICHGTIDDFLLKRMWIPQQTAFFRAEAINAVGIWDERIPYTPDVDLWLRIWFSFPIIKAEEIWGVNREHADQRDKQGPRIQRDWNLMIRQSKHLKNSPWQRRLAAAAGCHMNAVKYNNGSPLHITCHYWLAIILWPPLAPICLPNWRHLIPGYVPILKIGSILKQRLRKWMSSTSSLQA